MKNVRQITGVVILSLTLLLNAQLSAAENTAFSAAEDTFVDEDSPTKTNGHWENIAVRNRYKTDWALNGLVRFDLSSFPAGTTVTSAALSLYYFANMNGDPNDHPLEVHYITSPWSEAATTWNTRPSFNATPSDSVAGPPSFDWVQWDVTTDVGSFLDGTNPNLGWQLMDAIGGGDNTLLRLYSKEFPNSVLQPRLDLTYNVIYVDASATGGSENGSSWANAYTTLQDALYSPPPSGYHVWVAQGTYKPDDGGGQSPGSRSTTFDLIDGVAIVGGFPSGGGTWEQRNPDTHPTVLSGNIGAPDSSDNCYHVVTAANTITDSATIDGFIITAGDANDTWPDTYGAGMFNEGDPTIANCTFVDNSADGSGAGLYNTYSAPLITNCTFYANVSGQDGGGMSSGYSDNMVVTDCLFLENRGGRYGGGVLNYNSSGTFINCMFRGNSASDGGAMYNDDGGSPTLMNCLFSGNHATNRGGAIRNKSETSEPLSSPFLVNCTLSGNHANTLGGGMRTDNEDSGDDPCVVNCIFWGNTHGDVSDHTAQIAGPDYATVSYSCIQDADPDDGSIPFGGAANSNIDDDPLFILMPSDGGDPWGQGNNDTYGNLRLDVGSPAIDAADNTAVPADATDLDHNGNTSEKVPLDLDRFPRFVDDPFVTNTGNPSSGDTVDMGAYERGDGYCGDLQYPYPIGDLSGPEGIPDCTVNLYDLNALSDHWLEYTGP